MATTAGTTATGEQQIAGQETNIAAQQRNLAAETQAAGQQAETGDFIASALKGAAAVASLFTPAAGGAGAAAGSGSEISTAPIAALALL